MLGTLIGGAVIGGIVSGCVNNRKAKKDWMDRELERQGRVFTQVLTSYSRPKQKVVTKTVVKKVEDPKLKLQVKFFDSFRELDNKLARMVREGYKGVTYLVKGLEVTHGNQRLINALKNIRNYRNRLSHDKRRWKEFPAPTSSIMEDLRYAQSWVDRNSSDAARLAWKGKTAFNNSKGPRNR